MIIQLIPIVAWCLVLINSLRLIKLCKCKFQPRRKEAAIVLTSVVTSIVAVCLQVELMVNWERYEEVINRLIIGLFLFTAMWDLFILRYINDASALCSKESPSCPLNSSL